MLALLGESGSGKSVTLRAILGLHPAGRTRVSGAVLVKGQDVNQLDERARVRLRGGVVSLVFQEPMTALDPVYTLGEQIVETLVQHRVSTTARRRGGRASCSISSRCRRPSAACRAIRTRSPVACASAR